MRIKGTPVQDNFYPDELRIQWAANKHPNLDIAESVERFLAWATSHEYVNHSRAWQNFIIRAADENKLTPMLKRTQPQHRTSPTERWEQLKARAVRQQFRMPLHNENATEYESALNQSNVTTLTRMMK